MFKTVESNEEADITEKKSKFIANIFYITSEEEAEEKIRQIKRKHNTARHHCYAYRIIRKNEIINKSSDDGEPSGTAGMPMLNILEKNNFINILVVVTRYFGGILLGTGGLVKAYSEATQKVIEKSEIVIEEEGIELEIELNYKDLENFKYYCNKNNINIIDVKYSDLATCLIEANFVEKENITSNTNLSIQKYKIIRKKYIRKSQSLQEVRINMKLKTRKRMQWMVWRCYNAKIEFKF